MFCSPSSILADAAPSVYRRIAPWDDPPIAASTSLELDANVARALDVADLSMLIMYHSRVQHQIYYLHRNSGHWLGSLVMERRAVKSPLITERARGGDVHGSCCCLPSVLCLSYSSADSDLAHLASTKPWWPLSSLAFNQSTYCTRFRPSLDSPPGVFSSLPTTWQTRSCSVCAARPVAGPRRSTAD